jgi:hypothetical protein
MARTTGYVLILPEQRAEKLKKYVIPNPVRFLNGVRNLLFPWFPYGQQIPHPQTTRVRDDKSNFFRSLLKIPAWTVSSIRPHSR